MYNAHKSYRTWIRWRIHRKSNSRSSPTGHLVIHYWTWTGDSYNTISEDFIWITYGQSLFYLNVIRLGLHKYLAAVNRDPPGRNASGNWPLKKLCLQIVRYFITGASWFLDPMLPLSIHLLQPILWSPISYGLAEISIELLVQVAWLDDVNDDRATVAATRGNIRSAKNSKFNLVLYVNSCPAP